MELVNYWIFRIFIFIFRLLPFTIIYLFSSMIAFLMHKVFGYRLSLVKKNVHNSFPNHSKKDTDKIIQNSYSNLADIIVEGIKGATMNKKQLMQRYKFLNPELLDEPYENNQSVILVTGHLNNWEWGALGTTFFFDHTIVGIYKKLSNAPLENYFKRSRANHSILLYELNETGIGFEKHAISDQPSLFMMVADQSPSNMKKAIWTNFLGQNTACLHGPEFYSKKYKLPIVYCDIQRKARGKYELTIDWLIRDPSDFKQGEITALYMDRLESKILKSPGHWLWSHNRWKRTYDGQDIITPPQQTQ